MSLSGTIYERQFSEILISLQPLAVLPFQLSIDFITSRLSLQGSATTSFTKDGSPRKDNSVNDKCMTESFSKEKAIIGVAASKAWDWLKNGAAPKSPNDEVPSPPILTGNIMISSLTGILGKLSGTSKSEQFPETDENKEKNEAKNTEDGERPIMAVGLLQMEAPPAKPPRTSLNLDLLNNEVENGASAVDVSEEVKETPLRRGDNSSRSVPSDENNSMLSSFSGIAQKLLGINPENTEKIDSLCKKAESEIKVVEEKNITENVDKPLVVLRRKKADISDVESDKSKSGLIRLFDKLLLPRDSSKKEQKLKSRWSWGYGQGQQVKAESLATKNVPTKSDVKSSSQLLPSKVPCYTQPGKGGSVQSRSSIATVSSKLVARQPIKNTSSNLKNAESSSPKTSINIQDSKKDQSAKSSKDRPPIKSKVPVRKVASQKVPTSKEQTKNVEPKCDKVPKENKWQGAISLSASLEEGPTLKAPPSVTQKVIGRTENKIDKKSKSKEQTKLESTSKGLLKRKLDSDDTLSRVTYKDAIATDGCENALHLSDEINCNSPNPNVGLTIDLASGDHANTADTGFIKPNFR